MSYSNSFANLQVNHPDVAHRIARVTSLESVIAWLQSDGRPLDQLDLVAQDEYCHDLLVPLQPDLRWIVFGMT